MILDDLAVVVYYADVQWMDVTPFQTFFLVCFLACSRSLSFALFFYLISVLRLSLLAFVYFERRGAKGCVGRSSNFGSHQT